MEKHKCQICRKEISKEDGNNFLHTETMLQGSCLFKDNIYFCSECSERIMAFIFNLTTENIAVKYGVSKKEQYKKISEYTTQILGEYARKHFC